LLTDLADLSAGLACASKLIEAYPNQNLAWIRFLVAAETGEFTKLRASYKALLESAGSTGKFLNLFVGYTYVLQGQWQEAIDAFSVFMPELAGTEPMANQRNWGIGVFVAFCHHQLGNRQLVEKLSAQLWPIIRSKTHDSGLQFEDALLLIANEQPEKALEALESAFDEGVRSDWRLSLVDAPFFSELHEQPAYQTLVARFEEDMARQQALLPENVGT
jgi:hypothetical protein